MKVTREKAAEHRRSIVEAAGRLFRRSGPDAVSVADVTREAGLTHGGFYGHFPSKEALFADAAEAALVEASERIARLGTARGAGAWPGVVRAYLSPDHLEDCEQGCTIAALSGDMSRRPAEIQAAFARGLDHYLASVETLTGGRAAAIAETAAMVGALVMARAVGQGAPGLSAEILDAVKARLLPA